MQRQQGDTPDWHTWIECIPTDNAEDNAWITEKNLTQEDLAVELLPPPPPDDEPLIYIP